MKHALFVLVTACSSKSAPPGPGSAAPPPVPAKLAPATAASPPTKEPPPIDLPAAGVSKLVIHPDIDPANYMGAEWNGARRDATMACREDAYNLVWIDFEPEGEIGTHDFTWIPNPFVTAPHICELRFYDQQHRILARACWRDGALAPRDCALPPPRMPEPPVLVNIEGASVHVLGTGVRMHGLVTLESEAPRRHFNFGLRCDGVASKRVDDWDQLGKLDAGDTIFVQLTFELARPIYPSPPKQCELTITDPKLVSTFCIAEGSTEPGPCGK